MDLDTLVHALVVLGQLHSGQLGIGSLGGTRETHPHLLLHEDHRLEVAQHSLPVQLSHALHQGLAHLLHYAHTVLYLLHPPLVPLSGLPLLFLKTLRETLVHQVVVVLSVGRRQERLDAL